MGAFSSSTSRQEVLPVHDQSDGVITTTQSTSRASHLREDLVQPACDELTKRLLAPRVEMVAVLEDADVDRPG